MKKMLFSCFIVLLLFGCASEPPATKADTTRTYSHDYDKLFNATKKTLFEFNCEIVNADKDTGFVNARFKLSSELATALMLGQPRVVYQNYQFMFLKSEGETTIQASLFTAYDDGSYKTMNPKSAYDRYWEAFELNLAQ